MTRMDYLSDTYLFSSTGKITRMGTDEKFGDFLVLDRTIFYPQGGGQPCDTGKISDKNGNIFMVSNVRLDINTGEILHFGEKGCGNFSEGTEVDLEIDAEKRKLHARLHSAGHLIDNAFEALGISGITPKKGYHFTDGPYVEYEGGLENPMDWVEKLENKVNDLVRQDLAVICEDLSPEKAEKMGVWAPPGKSARVVKFEDFDFGGCGGTHVNASGEIGEIVIRKISSKKGKTRVAYSLAE